MLDEIQSFFKTSWFGIAIAILLLIAGWKMTTPIANFLLVIAWAILLGAFYRTPIVAAQPIIPMILLVAGFGSATGVAIYFTLWTKVENVSLGLVATTSAAVKPSGTTLGGIPWLSNYGDLRIVIINDTKVDYQNVDIAILPDVAVTAAAQLSNIQGISLWRDNEPSVTTERASSISGRRVDAMFSPIASTLGYRLRCEMLPAHSHIELIMAVVTMNDGRPSQAVDEVLRINFSSGLAFWLALRDHTEKIFGDRPVPHLVKMTGHYMAQQREYEVSEKVAVTDSLLGAIKHLPKL